MDKNPLKDMDIEAVVRAIEADAGEQIPDLREALAEAKAGKYARIHTPEEILVRSTRRKLGLSQEEFAKRIGTPLATLRGWEQGRFTPPGAALHLMRLLNIHPNLIEEDGEPQQTFRFDKDVMTALISMGDGWQVRANEVMRNWVASHAP